MARMIPEAWADLHGSRAEGLVYRKLRDETPEDWFAIHSVGLTSHERKPWAEVDFVVISDQGVFCLEIKGGDVKVVGGRWMTYDRRLAESPYEQAGGAAAALHHELRDRFAAVRTAVTGWGVVLPDVRFDRIGPGIERAVTYDDRDLATPFRAYLERLARHWRSRHAKTGDRFRPLSRSDRSEIAHWIAPSFELVRTLRSAVAKAESELALLTQQQTRVMRGLRRQRRVVVRGGAGTGKTMLAAEEARRLADHGDEVLFTCRSALLAAQLAESLKQPHLTVAALEGLMRELVTRADGWGDLPDAREEDVRDVLLPDLAAQAAIDLGQAGSFDALVVDEGQDLLSEANLELLGVLLRGGLEEGGWRFFLDPRQNVFSALDLSQLESLERIANSTYDLTENCRNAPPVATLTYLMAAVDPDEVLATEGPEVDLRWAKDDAESWDQYAAILLAWIRGGVPPDDITILGVEKTMPTSLSRAIGGKLPAPTTVLAREKGRPAYCSIEDFKGLESPAVLLTGLDDLESREARRKVYVGCSRARVLLGLVLRDTLKPVFDLRAKEYARLLADTSDA